jgi:hypothetical protein
MTFDQWWKNIFGDKKIPDWIHETVVRNVYEAAVKAEREACAKLCDEMAAKDHHTNYYLVAANAIRARGEK